MAAASSALLVTTGGVLYRLEWDARARAAARLVALSELLRPDDAEFLEAEAIARALGDERLDTDALRIAKRAIPGWSEMLREAPPDVRRGHLDNARRRWGDRPLPKLPGPATPNDYQKVMTLVPGLHRSHWRRREGEPRPRTAGLRKLRALLAARWFSVDEVARRVRERHGETFDLAAQVRLGARVVDPWGEPGYDQRLLRGERALLDDVQLLRERQRARLAEAF